MENFKRIYLLYSKQEIPDRIWLLSRDFIKNSMSAQETSINRWVVMLVVNKACELNYNYEEIQDWISKQVQLGGNQKLSDYQIKILCKKDMSDIEVIDFNTIILHKAQRVCSILKAGGLL